MAFHDSARGINSTPQCLHFRASARTNSRQSGHLTWVRGVTVAGPMIISIVLGLPGSLSRLTMRRRRSWCKTVHNGHWSQAARRFVRSMRSAALAAMIAVSIRSRCSADRRRNFASSINLKGQPLAE